MLIQAFVWSAVGTGQTTLFGNNQNKLGSTLGAIGTFGATGFNSGASTLGFGAPQQPVGEQLETDCLIQSERLKGFHSYTCMILICGSLWWFLCSFYMFIYTQSNEEDFPQSVFIFVPLNIFSLQHQEQTLLSCQREYNCTFDLL